MPSRSAPLLLVASLVLAGCPAGDLLAALGENSVDLGEVASGRLVARGAAFPHGAHCLAFSPDGRRAATGGKDGSVIVWSLDGLARAPAPR